MRSGVATPCLDFLRFDDDVFGRFPHRLAVALQRRPIVRGRTPVYAPQGLFQEEEVDAPRFHAVVFSTEAEVDHHDLSIADDHVRGRQIAVDDPGPVQASADLADHTGDFYRGGPSFVEDILRGRTFDELHDNLVLHEIDVI